MTGELAPATPNTIKVAGVPAASRSGRAARAVIRMVGASTYPTSGQGKIACAEPPRWMLSSDRLGAARKCC